MATVHGKGAEIIGASLKALNVEHVFGLPHPPASELHEFMAARQAFTPATSVKEGGFLALGCAIEGARSCVVSTGTDLFDLMEILSYATSCGIPFTVIQVGRSLPGFGNPYPYQGDFDLLTGGDYPPLVIAPSFPGEIPGFLARGIALSEKFGLPFVFYLDSALFHMTGTAQIDTQEAGEPRGLKRGGKRVFTSIHLDVKEMKDKMESLDRTCEALEREAFSESYRLEDATVAFVAYGVCAFVAKGVVDDLRLKGVKVGLVRPVTLFPLVSGDTFPEGLSRLVVVEMSNGQLLRSLRSRLPGRALDGFTSRAGFVPEREELSRFAEGVL